MTRLRENWTTDENGISNSSKRYLELVDAVERLIRGDAHKLLAGKANDTARLIVSNLAHEHCMIPGNCENGGTNCRNCPGCANPALGCNC